MQGGEGVDNGWKGIGGRGGMVLRLVSGIFIFVFLLCEIGYSFGRVECKGTRNHRPDLLSLVMSC